jgi:hypothetical protein
MRLWTILPIMGLCLAFSSPARGDSPRVEADPPAETPSQDSELDGLVLSWSYFRVMAEEDESMVIDVRADFLSGPTPPGMETARPIPLTVFRDNFVARKANQNKVLLIFDETGQTYPALHNHLRDHGYVDYYFLSGGVENTLKLLGGGS